MMRAACSKAYPFVVPNGWPQIAAAAVHLSMHAGHTYVEKGVVPVIDCGPVCRAAAQGPLYATHEKRPWAAVWADNGGKLGPPVTVKAHLTKEQSLRLGQEALWRGNAVADSVAKRRALQLLPPQGLCDSLDAMVAARTRLSEGC